MLTRIDPLLLLIGSLLAATLMAFFAGLIYYPIGWIVLTVLFAGRLLHLKQHADHPSQPR